MHTIKKPQQPVLIDVVIEVPLGSFVKRNLSGKVEYISPLPSPFNYGSVPSFFGTDGDLLDAVVLGPRLPVGTTVRVAAWGAVAMVDGDIREDKLICSPAPISPVQQRLLLAFFQFYAKAKYILNFAQGIQGHNSCRGWCEAAEALERAKPRG